MFKRALLSFAFVWATILVPGALLPAAATTFIVLHQFSGADGSRPGGHLLLDQKGNIYGTTSEGGANGKGTFYKLDRTGAVTLLYSFCAQPSCADGAFPEGGVIADSLGNLYGTTESGGSENLGTVYRVHPAGGETVLSSFHTLFKPYGEMVLNAAGTLYGVSEGGFQRGGCPEDGCGAIFFLVRGGKGQRLYAFAGSPDGRAPNGELLLDGSGNILGTTIISTNAEDVGTVFEVAPNGSETTLHEFSNSLKIKGLSPHGGLIADAAGNLYGTTYNGGKYQRGLVYKLAPDGTLTKLYSFCGCSDGDHPEYNIVMDSAGNIYGVTNQGGVSGGVVYKVSPDGKEQVLHAFCTGGSPCSDGEVPSGGLTMDARGNLYGVNLGNGTDSQQGVAYKIKP